MKKTALLIAVVAASLPALAPSVVFADTTSGQATVKTTDSSIKSAIKAQFAAEKNNGYALSHIDVDVNHHGVVALEGKVASQEAADRAVSIARATDGVRDVKNQLKIKTTND